MVGGEDHHITPESGAKIPFRSSKNIQSSLLNHRLRKRGQRFCFFLASRSTLAGWRAHDYNLLKEAPIQERLLLEFHAEERRRHEMAGNLLLDRFGWLWADLGRPARRRSGRPSTRLGAAILAYE
jgi:hypothetical protein